MASVRCGSDFFIAIWRFSFEGGGFNKFRTSIQWNRWLKTSKRVKLIKGLWNFTTLCYWSEENDIGACTEFTSSICQLVLQKIWRLEINISWTYSWSLPRLRSNVLAIRFITGPSNEQVIQKQDTYMHSIIRTKRKGKEAVQVIYNLNLASAKWFNSISLGLDGEIGIILNLTPAYPKW